MESTTNNSKYMPFAIKCTTPTTGVNDHLREKSAERYTVKRPEDEELEGEVGGETDEGVKGEINDLTRYSKSKKG